MADPSGVRPETDLVRRAREGDTRAFEELVRRHQKQLYAMLYRLTNNVEDTQELVQRSFVKALAAISRFRGDASFGTWVRHIAMNTYRNFVRDEAKRRHVDIETAVVSDPVDTHDRVEEKQLKHILWREAGDLPLRQREALVLRAQEGYSFQEIAGIMGCSEGAAKAHYHHAVKKLKKKLRGQE